MIRFHIWKKPKTLKFTYIPQHYDPKEDKAKLRASSEIGDVKERIRNSYAAKPHKPNSWYTNSRSAVAIASSIILLFVVSLLFINMEFILSILVGS